MNIKKEKPITRKRRERIDALEHKNEFSDFLALAHNECFRQGKADQLYNKDGLYSASAIIDFAVTYPVLSGKIYDFEASSFKKGHEGSSITRKVRTLNEKIKCYQIHGKKTEEIDTLVSS